MSYKMTKQGTTNEFICEFTDDLQNIPKDEVNFGSLAIVMENAQIYMANSKKRWNIFGLNVENEDKFPTLEPVSEQEAYPNGSY